MFRKAMMLLLVFAVLNAGAALAQEDTDSFWPRQIDPEGGRIIVYQPQVENYTSDRLEARAG